MAGQIDKRYKDDVPPWNTPLKWREANWAVEYIIDRYGMKESIFFAEKIFAKFSLMFSMLDSLCHETCSHCPDICCFSAKAWFDFKDLLFLHLNRIEVPEAQPISGLNDTCRFLGNKGCELKRESRPWICTWYLCRTQLSALRKNYVDMKTDWDLRASQIKKMREKMEYAFIKNTVDIKDNRADILSISWDRDREVAPTV